MIAEFLLGACSGVLTYVVGQKVFDAKARKEAAERLDAADRLLRKTGFSYVWYDAEAGGNDSDVSDALLLVGTQSDRIVVTATGHLVGAFYPTDSLYVAGTFNTVRPERPRIRLVVSNDDST